MKEIKFLIWNTSNKSGSLEASLSNIISNYGIFDIIVLSECKSPLSITFCIAQNLVEFEIKNAEREILKQRIYIHKKSKAILTHLNNILDTEETEREISTTISGVLIERTINHLARAVILELEVNNSKHLFACIHFPSKKNLDEISQLQVAHNYKRMILERAPTYENKVIITGDFNMNPFDAGMVEPMGFYALNNTDYVKSNKIFQYSIETMLYNPCWWLLGDYNSQKDNKKVSGTHFYGGSPSKKLYWHLFDQVIISKEMIDKFIHKELEIIELDYVVKELTITNTDRKKAIHSDHLPLKFTLKL